MEGSHDLFSRILSLGPSPSTLLLVLRKMKEDGRIREVIPHCIRALGDNPDDIRLRHLLAESYLEAGFVTQAEKELEEIEAQLKTLASVFKLQAEVYRRQSRSQEAADALRIYLAHNPNDLEAVDLLDQLMPVEDTILPDEVVAQVHEPAPDAEEEVDLSGLATPTLAEIYLSQGQIREAISTYEKVLDKSPGDELSRHRLSEIKAEFFPDPAPSPPPRESGKKKEKLITALEGWLMRIQELNRAQ